MSDNYGSSRKTATLSEVTHGKGNGTDPLCADAHCGAVPAKGSALFFTAEDEASRAGNLIQPTRQARGGLENVEKLTISNHPRGGHIAAAVAMLDRSFYIEVG